MADYAADINPSDYLYKRAITVTEKTGSNQTDVHLRLQLYSTNFNFNFARSDGLDFRLAEGGDGTRVLNTFVGYWNASLGQATLYFKLPLLRANDVKTLYAYFGNSSDSGISDIHSLDFYLSDHFDNATIYNNNWSVSAGVDVTTYFGGDGEGHTTVLLINQNNTSGYIQTKTDPIPILTSYAVEMGYWMYEDTDINDTWKYSHAISFWGSGLNQAFNYFAADGEGGGYITDDVEYGTYGARTENFEDSASSYPGGYYGYLWGSLVLDSYHQNFFGYYLPTDNFYYGMYNRNPARISSSCPATWAGNYLSNKERKIENDSDFTRVRIWGARRGGYSVWAGTEVYFDWVLIRKFLGAYEPEWDLSNLYTDIENVEPDPLAFDYGPDVTDVNHEHTTTSGGIPSRLSDDSYGSLSDIWCSDDGAASGAGVDLVIDYSVYGNDLTDVTYIHYDSGHELWLNASKLSDEDSDAADNYYWSGTTSSGWACIDFDDDNVAIGIVKVKGVASDLSGMPKNYKIEGSFIYTDGFNDTNWKVLSEGQFSQVSGWQSAVFVNNIKYRFYRLKVIDTYGANIALQEWQMYEYGPGFAQYAISKLRLKPAAFDSQYIYFPKQIGFYGSNDLTNWTTLISTKNTYTPYGGSWQEYNFTNVTPFYHYKLTTIGNWNSNSGRICIAEWEMKEAIPEAYTYWVSGGTHNDYSSICAEESSTFDDLELYLVNDVLSHINNGKLAYTKTFTGSPTDLNSR
jgi:hypothetical protein